MAAEIVTAAVFLPVDPLNVLATFVDPNLVRDAVPFKGGVPLKIPTSAQVTLAATDVVVFTNKVHDVYAFVATPIY